MKNNLKYHLLTTFFLLVVFTLSSQQSEYYAQGNDPLNLKSTTEIFEKEIDVPFYLGQKIFWYDSLKLVRENLNLEDLEKSKAPQHIRIWTDKSAIDAWKDEVGEYHCVVTSFCKAYDVKKEIEGEFFLRKINVEEISAQVLIDSLYAKEISTMKDYHHIKKVNKNLIDGVTYKIEISTPASYRMFTFLNPENQGNYIDEVELFMSYLKTMNMEFDLNYIHRQFMMSLKNGVYVAGLDVITKKNGYTKFSNR